MGKFPEAWNIDFPWVLQFSLSRMTGLSQLSQEMAEKVSVNLNLK